MPTPASPTPASASYEIRLRGHLDARWADRLGVPSLSHDRDGTTVLSGIAADQAVLHGVLLRIRDLGLPVLSVLCVGPDRAPPQS
jgi:hypothetical protein